VLVATKAIHDGPHRGPVRQANHSADETTQRYPANPRVIRGYGYHLSAPSLLVSTHPSPPPIMELAPTPVWHKACPANSNPPASRAGINDFTTTSPSQWTSLIPTAHVCRLTVQEGYPCKLLLIASALLVAPSATMLRSGRDQRYLKICPARLSHPNNAKPPFTIKTRMKITA
jgi:hypothetical protein